jgi:AraC-like DNA-binding protein
MNTADRVSFGLGLRSFRCNHAGSPSLLDLKYAAPSPALAGYISAFYLFETDEVELEEIERADIAQLRFILKGGGQMMFPAAVACPIAPVSIVGPRMKASRARIQGPAATFGMGLLPAGWMVLTHSPAHNYVNGTFDAHGLVKDDIESLRAAVDQAESFDAMVAASEQFFVQLLDTSETPPFRLIQAVDEWLEDSIAPDVGTLSEKTGLSPAQLQRQLKAIYGASPKLLARKYRALKTAVLIANGEGVWQDYVGEAYYDQSHCIREIKEFTGITPAAIRKTPRLTRATFERHKLKGQISKLATEI